MKKICILALTLVLTASALAGCRNRTQPMETTRPTTAPTTQATTVPTTQATQPTTEATRPSETVDHGNGPLEGTDSTDTTGSTASTDSPVSEGRSIGRMPKN